MYCVKYLFFVVNQKTGNQKVQQTTTYVQWTLNFLQQHQFFLGFEFVKFWSDGCGKHFKTYETQFYMGMLQENVEAQLSWDVLPPGDAHNRCDAAAGHLHVHV